MSSITDITDIRSHFNRHIAVCCDAIEGVILATETDPAEIRGAQIALDAMRRIVGAPIPNRGTTKIIDCERHEQPAR